MQGCVEGTYQRQAVLIDTVKYMQNKNLQRTNHATQLKIAQ